MCVFFSTEEERHLQANNREFNLEFEYAVSNNHMFNAEQLPGLLHGTPAHLQVSFQSEVYCVYVDLLW